VRTFPAGLQAALLLARGRSEALSVLGEAADAFATARRSFWAMAFCLPAFICLRLIAEATAPGSTPPGAHGFAADLLGAAIGWLAFALASHRVAGLLGRAREWPRFIALWNWCNLVQYLALVVAALPDLLGLPAWMSETAWLVAVGWALWLEWFTTALALSLPGVTAAGLVLLDLAIGLAVSGMTS
jgi:hypothetical protein